MRYVECDDCYGSGSYDIGPECGRPASECCGGCYRTVECETCNGKGEILKEDEDENN